MEEFEYYAFISYKREDEKWAKWLQNKLETYKIPISLAQEIGKELPISFHPCFRDKTDLSETGDLNEILYDKLQKSQYLIIICSPRSAKSIWVNKEVETFQTMRGIDKIIPFIIEGTPDPSNSEIHCYPPVLDVCTLGVSVVELGKKKAFIKLISVMININFDALWNRHRERVLKYRIKVVSIIGLFVLCFAFVLISQSLKINRQQLLIENHRESLFSIKENVELKENELKELLIKIDRLNYDQEISSIELDRSTKELLLKSNELEEKNKEIEEKNKLISLIDSDILKYQEEVARQKEYARTNQHSFLIHSSNQQLRQGNIRLSILLALEALKNARYEKNDDKLNDCWLTLHNSLIKVQYSFIKSPLLSKYSNKDRNYSISNLYGKIIMTSEKGKFSLWKANGTLIRTLGEHTRNINFAVLNKDENRILTASDDNYAKLWSIDYTNSSLMTFSGHTDKVNYVVFSPDETLILTASNDNTAKLWDIKTGKNVRTFIGHDDDVKMAVFSPEGDKILTSSNDKTAKLWDVETGLEIYSLNDHSNGVYIGIMDSKNILTVSGETAILWDARTGKKITC